jgi:hypothetical protein
MENNFNKFFIYIFLLCATIVPAQEHTIPSPSFSFARSTAMGGAFTAVEDGIENILFNPAAMSSPGFFDNDFSISFNPLGIGASAANLNGLSDRQKSQADYWLSLVGIFLKNVSISNPAVQFSLLLSEDLRSESFENKNYSNLNTKGLLDNNYHAAAVRISLAKQVSIGASAYYFNHYENGEKLSGAFGTSYGIIMKPSAKMHAGISYFYFPDHVDSLMLDAYGIRKSTINAGICYSPIYQIKIALDVRNISGEDASSSDQIYAGLELLPSYRFAIRAGFNGNKNDKPSLSLGFGIGDFRPYQTESGFVFSNILLNYALRSEIDNFQYLYHSLTFLIRF